MKGLYYFKYEINKANWWAITIWATTPHSLASFVMAFHRILKQPTGLSLSIMLRVFSIYFGCYSNQFTLM